MKAATRTLVIALVCAVPAWAQQPAAEPVTTAPAGDKPASKFRDPENGEFDISSYLATPKRFLPVPIVITEPAIGYGGGLAGMFIRPREDAGSEGFARPNVSILGGFATENGTWGALAGDTSRWMDDRVQTLAGAGVGELHLNFYGLGDSDESLDEPVKYQLDFALLMLQGDWKPKPKSPWSIGLRYVYSKIEPHLESEPQFPGLADNIDIKISAPAAVLEYDSRNSLFTPTRGMYAESVYLASRESLGATEEFERFQQVVMGWLPLGDRVTLGLRGDYQWSSDGTPFFMRPYIKLRGVEAMRYQGDEMASAEVEARWQLRERWSLVGAIGYGEARTDRELFSGSRDVVSGAVGFRYLLARLFGLHAGLDVGFSEGTTAVYIQIGNAWFRP